MDDVMVAAVSRASMGGYISSQSMKKIIEINPYMLGTMARGDADCHFWHRNLGLRSKASCFSGVVIVGVVYGHVASYLSSPTKELYKRCGRLDDQIALLRHKLFLIQQGMTFNGKRTKIARSQGKKFQVSVE
ncbi:hypothetical protein M0R45_008517 [Rubus argutus]|uniref:Uncharacterized protein n=1 Tax=Rubus argutus TaxID=59490 RepID=A0AAW1Y298_RUBAR